MKDKSSGIPNPVAPQSVESLTPEKGPLSQERGQNPAAEADTLPSESNQADRAAQAEQGEPARQGQQQGAKPDEKPTEKPGVTPNEVMNEQVSPRDEQGDRMQSDRPHIGG